MRVLIADDEQSIRDILDRFLRLMYKDQRVESNHFSDPMKALFEMSLYGDKYDLFLLDVNMPRPDGTEVSGVDIYRTLAGSHPECLARILFVTAHPENLDELKGMPLSILKKPFHFEEFRRALLPFTKLRTEKMAASKTVGIPGLDF